VRHQSQYKVKVRHITIGGHKLLICIPLIAADRSSLLRQAKAMTALTPDLIEWRIDGFDDVGQLPASLETLEALRREIGTVPLIFTCRVHGEGGARRLDQAHRCKTIKAAIHSGHVDIVDVEMCNGPDFIAAIKAACTETGVRLILSYHNFDHTPEEAIIYGKLAQAQTLGADIAKAAVMPGGSGDVLALLNATHRARTQGVQIPIITMAMGAHGAVSRIAGGLFGSDITFAMGADPTAPGQIPIERLRIAMDALY
jgi:3-dehydroquinate dehydratase-1